MTDKITLSNVSSFQNDTSSVATVNANNAAITTAFDNTLSRDGTAPNQMGANLDMNNYQILNLPAPATSNSPARLIDVTGTGSVVTVPAGGASGQVLSKTSNTDYAMGWTNAATGTVNSVGLSLPADFTVTGSPVTVSGTLTGAWATPPTGSGAVVRQTSPTLTTPTLNSPTLTNNSNTLTLPTTTDTIVGRATTDTLTNKTITGGSNTLSGISLSSLSTQAANTLTGNSTGSSASPSAFTIDSLTLKASPATTDEVLLWDVSGVGMKKATVSSIGSTSGVSSVNSLVGGVSLSKADGSSILANGNTLIFGSSGGSLNKFRNGCMDIWQRGTGSTTVITSGAYTADGWIVVPTGASVTTAQAAGRSLTSNALQITGNTGVTDVVVNQRIESTIAAPFTSVNVTVQAQVYNNTGGSITPTLTVKHATAIDNWSASTTDVSAVSLQSCANAAWTKVCYTFAGNASSANGIEVSFNFGNNFSDNTKTLKITELDIRATPSVPTGLNSTPPAPELRPVGIEYPFNQRYFINIPKDGNNIWTVSAVANGGNLVDNIYRFDSTPMRATPTLTTSGTASDYRVSDGGGNGGGVCTGLPGLIGASTNSAMIRFTMSASGLTNNTLARQSANTSNGVLQLSAEL